ncbi:MAG TPA: signal recognition particle-docking protein FtsY [Chloroflexota bacterium]|nr:signal recognition particle-docking protein FtsY [Chloroflexota bacterium]
MFDRFRKIGESLRRSRESFFDQMVGLFSQRAIDESLWDELEELLIQADVGIDTTEILIRRVQERVQNEHVREGERAFAILREEMAALLRSPGQDQLNMQAGRLDVILVVGVNGTGKTTSIGKLAHYMSQRGNQVVLAAADTFRAAAIDQLKIWAERARVPVVAHEPNSDPGAVVFDGWQSATSRRADVLIVDTAGRLHTKFNLMEELRKISRVLIKVDPTAPHEVLLVLDATTGQNALTQARHFKDTAGVTGVVLAKLDGTAKGGMAFAIAHELGLPIKFVGTGEKIDDIAPFDADAFVDALFRRPGQPAEVV